MFARREPSLWLDQRGSALIEGAAVIPLLIALVFGVFEFSWLFYQQHLVTIGLHDAADYLARPRHRSPLSPGPRQAQSEEARPPGQRPDARALGDHLWRTREPNGNRLRLN